MKKILLALAAWALLFTQVRADEGMWMLPLLQEMNADAIRDLGGRLTPDQIYSINHSSIKDAVVQFGGGCTGEMISPDGLLVTNHHCGYGSIQSLSTPENNMLENGFWAMDRSQEIPVPGLTVKFLQSMTDVTDDVLKAQRKDAAGWKSKMLSKAGKANPNCKVEIVSFFNENVYYQIISKVYTDVRFVGAPPACVGKFGGETDNWMWPRHTCDFSMFRVYAGADGEPADYSPANVPMHPRQCLKVSLRGFEEGDFAMVMGYPGRTQRYQTASQLRQMLALNDVKIAARDICLAEMRSAMEADPDIRLKYASKFASISNGWKKWRGERDSFAKLGIIARQEAAEGELSRWIGSDIDRAKLYGDPIAVLRDASDVRDRARRESTLFAETIGRIGLLDLPEAKSDKVYHSYDADLDLKIAHRLLDFYRENADPDYIVDLTHADLEMMFFGSAYTSLDKKKAAIEAGEDLSGDPAVTAKQRLKDQTDRLRMQASAGMETLAAASKAYGAALMQYREGTPLYPDANLTCRLSYGSVLGYSPADGILYNYYTTLAGVMQKEDPDSYEFRVPERLKEIYETADYGRYANAKGEMPACFLTNLDITGGNSGSPVMDADGCLIGLAFDGNWEAMSSDVMFETDLQRCICVDIRYVLLMMDKFGGAGYLLDEMEIVR